MEKNPAFHERNTNISLRISPNFKLGVMNAAKDMGVSVTDYVESCIAAFEHEKVKTKECATLQAKLAELSELENAKAKECAALQAELAALRKQNEVVFLAFEPLFKKAQTSDAPAFKNSRPATMTDFLVMVSKTVKL